MPHYLASHHAALRLLERFSALATVTGSGFATAEWLGRVAIRTRAPLKGGHGSHALSGSVTRRWHRPALSAGDTPRQRHLGDPHRANQ